MREILRHLREASWPGLVLLAIVAVVTVYSIAVGVRE